MYMYMGVGLLYMKLILLQIQNTSVDTCMGLLYVYGSEYSIYETCIVKNIGYFSRYGSSICIWERAFYIWKYNFSVGVMDLHVSSI